MLPRIKLILFDFGNVISKQNNNHIDRILRLTRLERNDFDQLYRKYRSDYDRGWINGPEYWSQILKHSPVNPDTSWSGYTNWSTVRVSLERLMLKLSW